jgi:glycosyltransferase involved in cell wall biosynthesis
MKIAIVAPSQVPYVQGGAERLWRGLRRALESGGHLCELFNVPSPDRSFWQVIDTYRKFSQLNFDDFDVLVTGKNPAWMVPHPNHYVYMLHPLRGVYDTYHLFRLPEEVTSHNLLIASIAAACDRGIETAELFSMLAELREQHTAPDAELQLPSPFLRKVIHRFDSNALKEVRKVSAISKTVANRVEYFHGAKHVRAFYPVSEIRGEAKGPGAHFLAYSRLDGAKRVDLIIKAYCRARPKRPLLIAGDGPEAENLQKLAAGHDQIKFLGRVPDEVLVQLISDAQAVVFTPFVEDYGYVTVEALSSGRPVITVSDSGGPSEFVVDGENGWISAPSTDDLARSFVRADAVTDWKRMSKLCKKSVAKVRWDPLIEDIVEPRRGARASASVRRKKLVSLSTYPVFPPQGGGQARVFYLNRALSDQFYVEVVCLVDGGSQNQRHEISPSFVVHSVPASPGFSEFDWNYYQRSGVPTTDIAFSVNYAANHSYVSKCRERIQGADAIIAEQCYAFPLARELSGSVPTIYNSQNVELDLKAQMFGDSPVRDELLEWTSSCERLALTKAQLVVHCSRGDAIRAAEVYGAACDREVIVQNGTDTSSIGYRTSAERQCIRRQLGLPSGYCLFLGSWHEPNIQACESIFELARKLPMTVFCIGGTVGEYFRTGEQDGSARWSSNVVVTGRITENERLALILGASCAINPMSSGSGTNIKMLDYLAAGLPVLSTPVGARGLEEITDLIEVAELGDFPSRIPDLMTRPSSVIARRRIADRFDWRALGRGYAGEIAQILEA